MRHDWDTFGAKQSHKVTTLVFLQMMSFFCFRFGPKTISYSLHIINDKHLLTIMMDGCPQNEVNVSGLILAPESFCFGSMADKIHSRFSLCAAAT